MNIYTGVVASQSCQQDIISAYETGKAAQHDFVSQFTAEPRSLHRPMKRTNLSSFKSNGAKSRKDKKGADLTNRQLFARLIVLVKQGKVALRDALSYSLGPVSYPLASADGSLAKTPKSVVVGLIKNTWPFDEVSSRDFPACTVVIDIMCLIHGYPISQLPKTFKELAASLLGKICALAACRNAIRVDVVFDTYPAVTVKAPELSRRAGHNLKQATRLSKIVNSEQNLPKQWKDFLRQGQNKEQLADLLQREWLLASLPFDFYVAWLNLCYCRRQNGQIVEIPELRCDHIEADTRLFLHAKHASQTHATVLLSSTDSDVFVIGLCHAEAIPATIFLEMGNYGLELYLLMNIGR